MPPLEDGATSAPRLQPNELPPPPEPQPPTETKTTNTYKTFRLIVSGLPVKPDKQRVRELVRSAFGCSGENVHVRSIATDPVVPKRIMATLEFTAIPESLSRLSKESKHKVSVDGCDLVFDDHFLGLTALTDPEDEWAIDIVAVSGLNGHPFGSFKTRGGNWMWLRDGLNEDIPASRVLTYGLNTELINSKSSENIVDLGRQCREALFSISSTINKPLVLVGHSLGGIILREAVNLMRKGSKKNEEDREFLRSLAGILLFGVPSQGMAIESLQPMVGDGPNRQLLESLSVDSAFLQNQSEIFLETLTLPFANFDIVSFYETKMSQTAKQDEVTKQWSMTGPFAFLVDRHSATQGQVNGTKKHRVHPVPSNHGDVVKFEDQGDATYRTVLRELGGMLRFEPQSWRESEETEKECLRSLSFPNQATREVEIQPIQGTCEWLVGHPTYKTWLHNSCGLLWIRGSPGTGKSMAMKSLLQHTRAASAPKDMIASFFIHGRGNLLQSSELGLYRSLTHQLYQRFPDEFSGLTAFFKKKVDDCGDPDSGKWAWMPQVLLEHLSRALNTISRHCSVVIFVDALDEAGEPAALAIVNAFKSRLAAANEDSRLKICFSCRHYPQITLDGGVTIFMEHHNSVDINCIVDHQLQYSGFEEWETARLKKLVCARSEGIIQWATLVVGKFIGGRTHGSTLNEALELVKEVPKGLYKLYESLLPATPGTYRHRSTRRARDRKLALKLFQWVLYAVKPLSARELQQALALDYNVESRSIVEYQTGNDYIDLKDLHLKAKSLSQGLIEIKGDLNMGKVQFIHQSVVDFMSSSRKALEFLSGGSGLPPARLAHFQLSRSCLRYLFMKDILDILRGLARSRSRFRGPCLPSNREAVAKLCATEEPFLLYTWQHWFIHLYYAQRNLENDYDDLDKADLFDLSEKTKSKDQEKQLQEIYECLGIYAELYLPDGIKFEWARDNLLLCLFAFCGSRFQVKKLLEARLKELRKSDLQYSPLTYAIHGRQKAIAEMLIQKKLGLDKGTGSSLQLELACKWGEADLVSMLLKGVWKSHLKSFSTEYDTPLSHAALAGHIAVIDILLGAGAKINARDPRGDTVLHKVVGFRASPRIARHLMERGADISSRNLDRETPLHVAARWNNVPVIHAILRHESSKEKLQKKPAFFSIGRKSKCEKMGDSKLLLINTTDRGCTPFATAVKYDNIEAVQALFDAGSEVDTRDVDGITPLISACNLRSDGVARFLLNVGADDNARGTNNTTCLMMACKSGHVDLVRRLLQRGFQNVNAATSIGVTALWNAIQPWSTSDNTSAELVKALIKSGAEVNIKARNGKTPLMKAAYWGSLQTCKLLLNQGAEVNTEDKKKRTALIYAVIGAWPIYFTFRVSSELRRANEREEKEKEEQFVKVLSLLLSSSAAATAIDKFGKSALCYADPRQTKILRRLREAGLDGVPDWDLCREKGSKFDARFP